MVNAGFLIVALAGFAAMSAAQPHGKHMHYARHRNLKARGYVTEFVTRTVDQYGNVYTIPVATPAVAASPKEYGSPPGDVQAAPKKPAAKKHHHHHHSTSYAASSPPSQDTTESVNYGNQSEKPASGSYTQYTSGNGVDSNFPDGELDCDHFPSEYGAVKLGWVTAQGWSGIQIGDSNGDSVGKCTEGAYCSYACPAGYSKAQWPDNQPANGESRGGLLCKGGKLWLTRNSFPKLCQQGKGTASVVNKLNKIVAICRTDYPGSENMVIPLPCTSGSSQPLTVPEGDSSYHWRGMMSSAQYYVNNAGIDPEHGCVWGSAGGGKGNWSPVVFGAGYSDDKTWLSISQNNLNSAQLNYNVRIVAADEDSEISGECKYENGKFSGATSGNGCTVAVVKGTANYELY